MRRYSISEFRAELSSPYAWPGGYPKYFLTADGAALSFDAAKECKVEIENAMARRDSSGGWQVIACEINWEDPDLYCDHTGERIEAAYAAPVCLCQTETA